MLIKTNISLDARSYSFNYTPTASALRLPFYLTAAGHFFARPDYYTERHDLNEYIVFFSLHGSGSITVRGETHRLGENQLFFLDCTDHHFYRTEGDRTWEFCYIQFSGPCVREYYDLFHENGVKPLDAINKDYMMQKFEDILKIPGTNTRVPNIKLSNLISDIMTSLILERGYIPDQKQYDLYKKDIACAIAYMEAHFDQNVKVEEIAQLLHISKYYFIKIFKSYTGITPYEYLINFRINTSKELLKSTQLSMDEIADRVGYPDASSFIRSFKKAVGTTPLKYRRL
ncbi:MAG: AraC family transcriptional regulator [Candidatus Howiella sp.]